MGQRAVADVEQAGVAADGERAAADDLHPRVVLGVVRGRHGHPTVETELADGEVEHLRADHPDIEDLGSSFGGAADDCAGHRRRGHAHVAPHGDSLRLELLDVCTADGVRTVLVQLLGIDPADVVGLEYLGIERHRRECYESAGSSASNAHMNRVQMDASTRVASATVSRVELRERAAKSIPIAARAEGFRAANILTPWRSTA